MRRAVTADRFETATPKSGLLALAVTLVVAAGACPGWAATHKVHHSVPVASTRDTDTSATGTVATESPRKHAAQVPRAGDVETLPPLFHLPQASRARMRDCGLKWQTMKDSGESGEKIWRDFATQCLAAANGPFDKRSDR